MEIFNFGTKFLSETFVSDADCFVITGVFFPRGCHFPFKFCDCLEIKAKR